MYPGSWLYTTARPARICRHSFFVSPYFSYFSVDILIVGETTSPPTWWSPFLHVHSLICRVSLVRCRAVVIVILELSKKAKCFLFGVPFVIVPLSSNGSHAISRREKQKEKLREETDFGVTSAHQPPYSLSLSLIVWSPHGSLGRYEKCIHSHRCFYM